MAGWTKEQAQLQWHGTDSIVRKLPRQISPENSKKALFVLLGTIGGMFVLSKLLGWLNVRNIPDALGFTVFAALIGAAAYGFYLILTGRVGHPDFIGDKWVLRIEQGKASYSRTPENRRLSPVKWAVSVDDIARVEAGKTAEYNLTRDHGGVCGRGRNPTLRIWASDIPRLD